MWCDGEESAVTLDLTFNLYSWQWSSRTEGEWLNQLSHKFWSEWHFHLYASIPTPPVALPGFWNNILTEWSFDFHRLFFFTVQVKWLQNLPRCLLALNGLVSSQGLHWSAQQGSVSSQQFWTMNSKDSRNVIALAPCVAKSHFICFVWFIPQKRGLRLALLLLLQSALVKRKSADVYYAPRLGWTRLKSNTWGFSGNEDVCFPLPLRASIRDPHALLWLQRQQINRKRCVGVLIMSLFKVFTFVSDLLLPCRCFGFFSFLE